MKQFSFLLVLCVGLLGGVANAQDPNLVLSVEGPTVAEGSTVDISVCFDNTGPDDVDGWSYGVCHDPAVLNLTASGEGPTSLTINGGGPGGFVSLGLPVDEGGGEAGYTYGMVIDLFGVNKLAPGTGFKISFGTYEIPVTGLMAPNEILTDIAICNVLGVPEVADVIVVGGASITPTEVAGTVTITGTLPDPEFIRGDCNSDMNDDVADGIFLLNMLFQGGTSSDCMEACDANNDGTVDMADAIYIFDYRFFDGSAPPAPFGSCGTDPEDPAGADCAISNCP